MQRQIPKSTLRLQGIWFCDLAEFPFPHCVTHKTYPRISIRQLPLLERITCIKCRRFLLLLKYIGCFQSFIKTLIDMGLYLQHSVCPISATALALYEWDERYQQCAEQGMRA